MYKKGFTLIELLVVIAIIGILSSVVLASLNTARGKGADAAIKSNLANMRAQAELYYDTNGGYSSVTTLTLPGGTFCTSGVPTAGTLFADSTFASVITTLNAFPGANVTCVLGGVSGQRASSWAMSKALTTGGSWCVDSGGKSASSTANASTGLCS